VPTDDVHDEREGLEVEVLMGTYDEEEFINYDQEGGRCQTCGKGRLKRSKRGKLYCPELCWVKQKIDTTK
jgi:formamidopyrimidine-DNA glycosylase